MQQEEGVESVTATTTTPSSSNVPNPSNQGPRPLYVPSPRIKFFRSVGRFYHLLAVVSLQFNL